MGLWRFVVSPRTGQADPLSRQVLQTLADFGVTAVRQVRTARLFTIDFADGSADERTTAERVARDLLTDPVCEECTLLARGEFIETPADTTSVEVHFRPGVMDSVADSTALALADSGIETKSVRTARRYELSPRPDEASLRLIPRLLGNDCVEEVVVGSKPIEPAPCPPVYAFELRHVPLTTLDDEGLLALSREGHLFLSLAEMRTLRDHFHGIGREPTDLELETLAQTWSEHCVHKTLKAAIDYRGEPMPAPGDAPQPTERRYGNLLKDTIARATDTLMQSGRGPHCLSVFKDNAGIIAFDDDFGIAFKVETHNHPSAIEPYGGSATGIGGVIRDIIGCGLGAKPIANTDVFCVAPPDWPADAVPKGVIHPKTILKGIVSGVRDYGNRMGIPTVNGSVNFDPRYLGNPLVYCGCVGLIPRNRIEKAARPGDAIVVLGGRTGRDGIHGATFSSAELTDTHEDEFAHAVQIGNAVEEKKVLDVVLQAREYAATPGAGPSCLYSAITDCGAGGLSSAVGEMAAEIGAEVDLEGVPLKYAGLRYDEIWISEAQERMVLAVPSENLPTILSLAAGEDVEATVIGRFTDTGRLVVRYNGSVVGDLDMHFLHEGLPGITRQAEWRPKTARSVAVPSSEGDPIALLKKTLADPNVASKHWIIRQYDHEVQGGSVVKPLIGPKHGPSDGAVVRPRLHSDRGIALGCGLALDLADIDPYWSAVAAIDEAIRNIVCVGGDPTNTAILDNFCWPRVDDRFKLGALVRSCQACHDAAIVYGVPFISGKDSLNNEFALNPRDAAMVRDVLAGFSGDADAAAGALADDRLAIPFTLLISAIALVNDVNRCISSLPQLTDGEATLHLVGLRETSWSYAHIGRAAALHTHVAERIAAGDILAAHDCGDGGPIAAVAEMAFGRDCTAHVYAGGSLSIGDLFAKPISAYIVQAKNPAALGSLQALPGVETYAVARLTADPRPVFHLHHGDATACSGNPDASNPMASLPLEDLRKAWQSPLDW